MLSYGGLEEVLKLLYLDLSPLSFLPKGMVVNNIGPGLLADLNYCRQAIPLIAQPLSESPNCASLHGSDRCSFIWGQGITPTHTFNFAYLLLET